jgi:Myb-like DNA-binding protein FlbD
MSRSSRRGPWLPEEDAALLHLVRTQGPNNWVRISQNMQHRSPKQCRERYHQNLKPSLNHEPISAQEGEVIEQLVQEMGKRWAEIARRLGNRSDNAVKNWWNGSMNRRKRGTVPQGGASKPVGYRTQPIPASALPLSTHHQLYLRDQPGAEIFSGPPPSLRHEMSASSIFDEHHRYSVPLQRQADGLQTHTEHRPLSYPQHGQHTTSMRPESTTSSLLGPDGDLLQRLHSWPSSRSEYQLAPLHFLDPPAPSPAATEASHASSHQQAPSLISDSQSNCSISPKTVTSPRTGMAATKVPSMDIWPEMQRRDSTCHCSDHGLDGSRIRQGEDDLHAYRSVGNQEPSFEKAPLLAHLSRPPSLPEPTIRRFGRETFNESAGATNERAPSPQEKDSRMTVSRLLD